MVHITKTKKLLNTIKKTIKSIYHFVFTEENTRNIKGVYQLALTFGLLITSFRFMILHNFFDIIKNGLSFICLLVLMISYAILTKEK